MERIANILKIQPGEGRLVALMIAMMATLSAGSGMGAASIDALLFSRFGVEYLPYLYILLGVITFLNMMAMAGLMGKMPRERLYRLMPLALGGVLLVSRLVLTLDLRWFYPVLFIEKEVMFAFQSMLIWGLAGILFDTRQARRLFPLLMAGSISGTTLGSVLTPVFVNLLGTENILIVWVLALAGGFALIRLLQGSGKEPTTASGVAPSAKSARRAPAGSSSFLEEIRSGYRFIRQSSLLQWYSLASILFSVVWFSILLPFSRAAAQRYPDASDLAGFLGLFQGLQTGIALLISLLLANRLFARFGVMNMLAVFPAIYLAGFGMLLVLASFSTIVLFRFVKLVWAQGIAETAWNVGFNAIPGARRDQARAFLNAIPGQAGVVISGILLVIGEQALSPGQMAWIGFISAFLCLLVIWQARRAYKLALVDALRSGQLQVFSEEEQPFGGFRNDATALPVALTGLQDPHPGVRRLSAEILQQLASPQAVTALQRAANDPDFEVRLAALKALDAYDPSQAVSVSIQALHDPQPEVRCQAIQILSLQKDGPELYLEPIRMAGQDPEPAVRAHAALAQTRFGEVDPAYNLLAGLANDPQAETRVEALRLLGLCWAALPAPDPRWIRIVQSGLEDEIAAVRAAAAGSLPVPPGELVEALVRNLGDDDRAARQAAAQAVGRMGSSAQPAVLDALHRPELESGALLALECLPGPPPVEALRTYAAQNVAQAVKYYNLANSLNANGHQPGGESISGTIQDGSHAKGERRRLLSESLLAMARLRALNALKALGLVTDRRSVDLSIESLDSPDRSQRAYAVETLDSLGEPQLVRPLIPIWEGSPASPIPLNGQWTEILHDPDPWLRACAVIFARDHPDDRVNRMLEDLARSDPDELVRSTAVWALIGEQPMETLQTVPTMERVLFLKRVRLFANLSPGDLKQIAATLEERLYTDGETIVELGDPGDEMYIITSGEVSVLGDGGRELARRKAGDIVGEMAIISQQPRMATMVAQGEVRALCIAQKQFEGILRERFEISMAVMRELCTRLRQSASRPVV